MGKLSYKKSGVDIEKADKFVEGIKGFISSSKMSKISAFGSLFSIKPFLKECRSPVLVASTDGVGTKLKIAIECGIHDTVGIDLVAMNVNDLVCCGGRPLFFLDYIACGKLEPLILAQVVKGINKGLLESDCLLLGGETAEMPGMYKEGDYDLAGFCVGIVDEKKIIDGRNIKAGDLVIGLESAGLHSNGFSLVRKVFNSKEISEQAKELLKPTRIYVKPILSLLSAFSSQFAAIKGIAHITGGAFYNKATKILPAGLGMFINKKSWPVPQIFKIVQEKGNIDDKEMYTVFNMGIGMVVVVDKKHLKKAMNRLSFNNKVYLIGEIVKSKTKMRLG
ncbi:MAG: phosphoribosylformylglycinamidine cyclo-ligase [Candidatus Omnitrophota bacterium]|nr:MAG: phosphoribosylformylglycinamidine cyclo-ligase [Candidatus Omnitrophota bacterium]